ncbi:MAG TPA: hypothetical protein VMG10_11215 [Gemmataceae bacterium]|nr:hypothetical protein [Gemmataceae bacterium]
MPYRVNCPTCKSACLIPEDSLGKQLLCPKCRQAFTVGKPKAPAPAAPKPPLPSASREATGRTTPNLPPRLPDTASPRGKTSQPEAAPAAPPPRRKKSPLLIVGVLAAVLLVVCGGIVTAVVAGISYLKHRLETAVAQEVYQSAGTKEASPSNPGSPSAPDQTKQPAANQPPTTVAEPPQPIELDSVPRDALAFCSLRVADTLKRPMAAGLRKQLQQEPNLSQLKLLSGLSVEDIDRVVAVFLSVQPEVEGVALVTTVKPYDRERLLSLMAPEKQEMKAGTATYYVGQKNPVSVHFLNERCFIVGLGKDMKKFLEQPVDKKTPGPLSEALATAAGTHTLVVGVRPRLLIPIEQKDVPPPYQGYLPLLDAKSATLTMDGGDDLRLGLRLAFSDEEQAKKGETAAKEALSFASLVMRQFPAMLEKNAPPEFKPLLPKVRGLIEASATAFVEKPPQRNAVVVEHAMRIQSPDWFNTVAQAAPFLAPRPVKPSPPPAAPKTPQEAEAAIKKLGGYVEHQGFDDKKPIIEVHFDSVKLTDDDFAMLSTLKTLKKLRLENNQGITATGLKHLRPLTDLEVLSITRNQLTDAGLAEIKHFKKLSGLFLSTNKITDKGLIHLRDLKELDHLALGGNDGITDAGLAHLKGLAKLKTLRLLGTRVSDKGAAEFKKARPDVNVVN